MRLFQFSLRTILSVTAFVALCSAVAVARPSWFAGLLAIFLTMLMPAFLLAESIQAKGNLRAFLLGALFTAIAPCVFHIESFESSSWVWVTTAGSKDQEIRLKGLVEGLADSLHEFRFVLFFWALAPFVGIATAALNWFLVPKRSRERE